MKPGEIISNNPSILLNADSEIISLDVVNTGDRPIQIGSHFHFFEVNRFLRFDRKLAFGARLNIPSGTAVRFEPGEKKAVELVRFSGEELAIGFNNLSDGSIAQFCLDSSIVKLKNNNFHLN